MGCLTRPDASRWMTKGPSANDRISAVSALRMARMVMYPNTLNAERYWVRYSAT